MNVVELLRYCIGMCVYVNRLFRVLVIGRLVRANLLCIILK